jgi:hypothetical protein
LAAAAKKNSDTPPTTAAAKDKPATTVAAEGKPATTTTAAKDKTAEATPIKDRLATLKNRFTAPKDQAASSKDQVASKDQPTAAKDQVVAKDQTVAPKDQPAAKDQMTASKDQVTAAKDPVVASKDATPAEPEPMPKPKSQAPVVKNATPAPLSPPVIAASQPASPARPLTASSYAQANANKSSAPAKTDGVRPTAAEVPTTSSAVVVPALSLALVGPPAPPETATPVLLPEMPTGVKTTSATETVLAAPAAPAAPPVTKPMPPPPPPPKTGPAPIAPAPACLQPTPDNCCNSCCCEDVGFTLTGHVGFAIVHPYWKSNPAFAVNTTAATDVGRVMEFGPAAQYVPEISIGVVSCNDWGFRINWWGFATSDSLSVSGVSEVSTAAPLGANLSGGPGNSFIARDKLGLNVWDFEGTQDWFCGPWAFQVAAGLRYAHISQRYDALESLGGPGVIGTTLTLKSGHNFNGIGPTLFARSRRQIGTTGAYLFASARGSLLYGRAHQDAFTAFLDEQTTSRMVMPVTELELGGGWRYLWSGIDIFAEAGLVNQVWFEAGNSSRSSVLPPTVEASPAVSDYNLGLIGFTLRAGINY